MDKATFPRQKVCAGWVTPAVMQELGIDLEHYASGNVLQPIHGFRIRQLGQKQVRSTYPGEPVSYGIRRIEFDNYLLQRSGLLQQRFGRRQPAPDLMEQLLFGVKKLITGQLMKTRWIARNIITERWFLHTHQDLPPTRAR